MVKSLCFSPDGRRIVSGSHDKTVRVWDAQTGNVLLNPMTGHASGVGSVVFSPNGKRIASGSKDKTIIIWAAHSGGMIQRTSKKHENFIRFVAFSPDGKKVISVSKDAKLCVWDADTGALLSGGVQIHPEGGLAVAFIPNSTYYCAISPDGKWIAGSCYSHNSRPSHGLFSYKLDIRDTTTTELHLTFDLHAQKITSIAFSPDSKRVLSASWDKIVQVYTLNF